MKVVLASGNAGKVREMQQVLAPLGFKILAQSEFAIPAAEETGLSFVENAIIKARHAAQRTGLPAIADDSGLEVDALAGAPGIYSARYAAPDEGYGSGDAANNDKLLAELGKRDAHDATARFQCVLAFMHHENDPMPLIAQGSWEGRILATPRGSNGFGYDPLFFVPPENCSAAQLSPERKNALSHRGNALRKLVELLGRQTPV